MSRIAPFVTSRDIRGGTAVDKRVDAFRNGLTMALVLVSAAAMENECSNYTVEAYRLYACG